MALTLDQMLAALQYDADQFTDADRRAVWQRKLNTANEIVSRYAPNAPETVRDEAVIRFLGWLLAGRWEGQADVSGLRSSGAAGLLETYRAKGVRVL